jgi:hypothetical protein
MAGVPKIVIGRLANGAVGGESHPDANLLSAFVEQVLDKKDRLQVLSHLTRCSECRDVVALATPEPAAMDKIFRPAVGSRFSWPVLRWGAAIACVVVVGAAVTLRQRERVTDQTHSGDMAPAVQLNSPQNTQPAWPAAALTPTPAQPATATDQTPSEGARSGQRGNSNLIPGRAKDDFPRAAGVRYANDKATNGLPGGSPLSSPGAPRWALTADGSLQRSFDMGRTWEPITVSVETSLRAVSASGADIWVGGTSGALYHSDDAGDHWMKIQPMAEGMPLTSDIVGVEFPDLEEGRLNTATGQVWTTRDGGSTWRVRPAKPEANASLR